MLLHDISGGGFSHNILVQLLGLTLAALFVRPACGQIPLDGSSFSIRSTIFRQSDSQKPNWIEVEESYSKEQRRARIDYRMRLSDDLNKDLGAGAAGKIRFRGSFVYDSELQAGLLMDQLCTRTNPDEIETTLGLYLPKGDDGIEDYIVGPARLLFFIDKHRNKMALDSLAGPIYVRNMRSLMYNYNHYDETTQKAVKFNVFYSELSRAADKDKSLPIQVVITQGDGALIIVDFWEPELMAPNAPRHLRRFESLNEHSSVDLFAYKLATGCSEALEEKRENLFATNDPDRIRQFSFRARIKSYAIAGWAGPSSKRGGGGGGADLFVAYDKSVNSLRVDSLSGGARSKSLFSLNLNRAYHVLHDSNKQILVGRPDGGAFEPLARSSECIVSHIYNTLHHYDETKFGLGKILLGAEQFVFMGRGQVHGVDALIYEANEASLPFWLDREVPYYDQDKLLARDPIRGLSGLLERKVIDVVAYFAAEVDGEHRLLMIDINQFDRERTRMYGKMTIFIDDFVWKIDNQSPTGERASEMFSLADDCSHWAPSSSFGSGQTRYGQVNLLLESVNQIRESESLLEVASLRETALIAGLQDRYKLPASMVYDLDSRIQKHRDHRSLDNSYITQLHVSFRVAKHSQNLAALEFLGFASSKSSPKDNRAALRVRSFEDCFIEAARKAGPSVTFGFRQADNVCLLEAKLEALRETDPALEAGSRTNAGAVLVLESKPGTVELYSIVRKTQKELWDQSTENRPELMGEMQTLRLAGLSATGEQIPFLVKAVHFDSYDRQSPFSNERPHEDNLENRIENAKRAGAIDGLAIVKDRTSKRIGQAEDKSNSMTEERCQAACLVDPDCKLYSVCLTNLETSCTTSGLDVAQYFKEIIELDMKQTKAVVQKLELQLPDADDKQQQQQLVELTKHPNCKLRLKNYLDLYMKPVDRLQKIGKRRLYSVDNVEKCAKMAALRNMKTLQEEAKRLPAVLSLISAPSSADGTGQGQALAMETMHRAMMETLLHGFYYFDKNVYLSTSQKVRDFITMQLKQLDGITDLYMIEGFCLMAGEPTDEEKLAVDKLSAVVVGGDNKLDFDQSINMYISYEFYQFKFETFYEKHHGIMLVADTMSSAEYQAVIKFSTGQQGALSESDASLVRSLLDRGDNIQLAFPAALDRCAEMCFGQEKGPWPGCRSFDFITFSSPTREHTHSMCFLNSITLKQAFANQRYDLVHDRVDSDDDANSTLVVHYEPRAGFIESETEVGYDISLLASSSHISNSVRIQAFGIFCIIILSLVGGVALGFVGASKYLAFKESTSRRQHEDSLVAPSAGRVIEFRNQVNSEGEFRVY